MLGRQTKRTYRRSKRLNPYVGTTDWDTQPDEPDAADAAETESRPAGQTLTTAHAFRMTLVHKANSLKLSFPKMHYMRVWK